MKQNCSRALVATRSDGAAFFRTALAALVLLTAVFLAQFAHARSTPGSFADLAERLSPAVVNISTSQTVKRPGFTPNVPDLPPGSPFEEFFKDFFDRGQDDEPSARKVQSLGSGFVVDPQGFIVTNNHVIENADEIVVNFADGSSADAELVGTDPKTDIALLKLTDAPATALSFVKFGDSDRARVGDWVLAIGNPFGLGGSVSAGIISARNRDISSGPYDDFIQTDAAINRGNSGGPLFNMAGDVIGVNTAIFSPTGGSVGVGFSVPSKIVNNVVSQLREFGETRRGWIGVRIRRVTDELAEGLGLETARGALVEDVTKDGPAEAAGVEIGDVIVSFDGAEIENMRSLPRAVADTKVDETVRMVVIRKGKSKTLKVTVGRLTEDGKPVQASLSDEPEEGEAEERTVLGMQLESLDREKRETHKLPQDQAGVLISDVESTSAAAKKGLRRGDVIVEVAQEAVESPEDVMTRIEAERESGKSSVLLLVSRQGDVRFVALRFEDKEQGRGLSPAPRSRGARPETTRSVPISESQAAVPGFFASGIPLALLCCKAPMRGPAGEREKMMPVFRTKASRSGTKALSVLLMGTVLAGCAAPNAMHPLAHREPTYLRMTEERAFAQALRQRYLELATNAYDRQDLARSDFYALRAIMAVEGKLVEPLDFDKTRQPDEFGNVVTRLNAALGGGVRLSAPQEAARAQAAYDCWRIESQKGGDPAIADACRSNALDAIAGLENIGVGTRIGKAGGTVPPRAAVPAPLPPAPVAAPAPMVMAEPAYPLAESAPVAPLEYAAPDQTHYAAPAIEAPMIDIGPLPEAVPAMPGHATPLAPLPEAESFGYAPLPPAEPYAPMEPVAPAYESAPMSYDSPLGYESIDPAPSVAGTAHQGADYESIDLGGAYAVLPEYGAHDPDMGGSDAGTTGYGYAQPLPAPAPFAPYEEYEPAASMGDPVPVYEMGPLDPVAPAAAGSYQAGAVDIGAMPATEDALLETFLSARSDGNARYSVYFGFDSDEVTPEAADLIVDALEQAILEDRDTILLMGFTDSSGDARYNQLLAMRRAQAVRKFMASRTEKRFNFEILPVGEAEAVRQGGDGVVEALNRKVEIRLR